MFLLKLMPVSQNYISAQNVALCGAPLYNRWIALLFNTNPAGGNDFLLYISQDQCGQLVVKQL